MASKSTEKGTQNLESTQDPSTSPPQRPLRKKSFPKRFHHGVDKSIPGIRTQEASDSESTQSKEVTSVAKEGTTQSKKVSFREPTVKSPPKQAKPAPAKGVSISEPSPSKKKPEPAKGKGKRVATAEPSKPPKAKRTKTKRTSVPEQGEGSQGPQQVPVVADAITSIYNYKDAPEGFSVGLTELTQEQATKFKENYGKKEICPVVSVNLEKLSEDCNLDLSPWLKEYESFVSISAQYSPQLVKIFYFNMVSDNLLNSDDELVEERVTTTVKGITFTLSASIINEILQIDNPPPVPDYSMSNREVFEILRPNEPIPDSQLHALTFTPVSMPPVHRVLWYIYSRNFIQKGGNLTHFTQRDYPMFATLVKKTPINLGYLIIQEMIKFRFSSRRPSHIPFPSLVSVILFYHKVWYVGPPEIMRCPPTFGKIQLNYMKINFEGEASAQSRMPSRSQASYARASQAQEGHSAPPPPSDFASRVKAIVDAAIASLSIRLEYEIGKLVHEVRQGNHENVDAQEELKNQIVSVENTMEEKFEHLSDQLIDNDAKLSTMIVCNERLTDRVDKIMKHLGLPTGFGASSSHGNTFGHTSTPIKTDPEPSSSPSFTFQVPQESMPSPAASTPIITSSPIVSTPTTEVLPTPSTPTTEVIHLSPSPTIVIHPTSSTSTIHLDSPPSTPLIDPLIDSYISVPSFEDDKGGEEEKPEDKPEQ